MRLAARATEATEVTIMMALGRTTTREDNKYSISAAWFEQVCKVSDKHTLDARSQFSREENNSQD